VDRLIVDAMEPVEENLRRVLSYIADPRFLAPGP
jgi:hypothetical protein